MECGFTRDHYEEICKLISNSSYRCIFFNESYNEKERLLLLRHDVDQSLESSLELAKIEKENGLKSTYFIWLTSPFYNIFDKYYSSIILEILSLGHQIGLHFDERVYPIRDRQDLNNYVDLEVSLLEKYFNFIISAVSMHRPSKWILENDILLDNYINTYSTKYSEEFKYISDSRMEWKEKCICQIISEDKYNKLHILTHPMSWINKGDTLHQKIIQFIIKKTKKLDMELSNNISVYHRLF